MKICKECKKMYNGADTRCTDCNKKYKLVDDINEPVRLCVVGGLERNMVCGALKDNDIPFIEAQYGAQSVANEIVTGYDAKLVNVAVLIPYSAVPKAYEILKPLEVNLDYIEPLLEQIQADIDEYKSDIVKSESMSRSKRTTVKVISALLFVLLMALVIFGTDYVMELIKSLLGG